MFIFYYFKSVSSAAKARRTCSTLFLSSFFFLSSMLLLCIYFHFLLSSFFVRSISILFRFNPPNTITPTLTRVVVGLNTFDSIWKLKHHHHPLSVGLLRSVGAAHRSTAHPFEVSIFYFLLYFFVISKIKSRFRHAVERDAAVQVAVINF